MSGWYWVALGGAVGAWLRFWLGGWVLKQWPQSYPFGTMGINVTGSFLLGLLAAVTDYGREHPLLWQGLGIGVLGAYTTFSTFGVEAVTLLERGQAGRALVYVVGSAVLGVVGAGVGMWVVR